MATSLNAEVIIAHKVILIITIQIIITILTLTRILLHALLILRALVTLRALIVLLAVLIRVLKRGAHASTAAAPIAVQPRKALVVLPIALSTGLGVLHAGERLLRAVERLLLVALHALIALGASLGRESLADANGGGVRHSAEGLVGAEANGLSVALVPFVLGLVLAHAVDGGVAVVLAGPCLALDVALVAVPLVGYAGVVEVVAVERGVEAPAVDAGVAGDAVPADPVEAARQELALAVVAALLALLGAGEDPAGVVAVLGWYAALDLGGYNPLDVSFRADGRPGEDKGGKNDCFLEHGQF